MAISQQENGMEDRSLRYPFSVHCYLNPDPAPMHLGGIEHVF